MTCLFDVKTKHRKSRAPSVEFSVMSVTRRQGCFEKLVRAVQLISRGHVPAGTSQSHEAV